MTWLALFGIHFAIGAFVGLVTVALVYRRRLLRGAILGAVRFIVPDLLIFKTGSTAPFFQLYLECGAISCCFALLADFRRLFLE